MFDTTSTVLIQSSLPFSTMLTLKWLLLGFCSGLSIAQTDVATATAPFTEYISSISVETYTLTATPTWETSTLTPTGSTDSSETACSTRWPPPPAPNVCRCAPGAKGKFCGTRANTAGGPLTGNCTPHFLYWCPALWYVLTCLIPRFSPRCSYYSSQTTG